MVIGTSALVVVGAIELIDAITDRGCDEIDYKTAYQSPFIGCGSAPANPPPDPDEHNDFQNNKSNSRANEIARQLGFNGDHPAEQLKDEIVPGQGSRFNIGYDKVTKEILLQLIGDSSVIAKANIFMPK